MSHDCIVASGVKLSQVMCLFFNTLHWPDIGFQLIDGSFEFFQEEFSLLLVYGKSWIFFWKRFHKRSHETFVFGLMAKSIPIYVLGMGMGVAVRGTFCKVELTFLPLCYLKGCVLSAVLSPSTSFVLDSISLFSSSFLATKTCYKDINKKK